MTYLDESICAAFQPPFRGRAWEWVEQNVELGNDSEIKGRVSFDWVPMGRVFLDACQDPTKKRIVLMVSAQSAKTKNVEFFLMWMVKNRPAETIWYQDDNLSAKTFYKTRLYPDLEQCPAIAEMLPARRDKKSQTLVQFDTMNLYVLGANKKTNRERITAAVVLCDEIRNYPPGAMQGIRNRYKTVRNYKEIIFSTAGTEGDELHKSFDEGSRTMFFWTCPHCQHKQTFRFGRKSSPLYPKPRECGGMIWEENSVTKLSEDVYNFDELGKTVRYECENPSCRHRFADSDKLGLIRSLEPIATNPMAAPDHVSMHWNEMYMPWEECRWPKIVAKFLRATVAARRGDKEPLKTIIQETFGEPWTEGKPAAELPVTLSEPDGKKFWEHQDYIFLLCDVQRTGFWVLVQAWCNDGRDYNLWAGELRTWDDVQLKAEEYEVPLRCRFVDIADRRQECLRECVKRGGIVNGKWQSWTGMRGEDKEYFTYIRKRGKQAGQRIKLPFTWPPTPNDASFGLHNDDPDRAFLYGKLCYEVSFAKTWIQDIATARRDQMELGKLSFVGPKVCPEFSLHLYAESKELFHDRDGKAKYRYVNPTKKPNHLGDCYNMGVTAACMARIIGDGPPE